MIELKLEVDDIDYEAIAERLLPALTEQMNAPDAPLWSRLLLGSQGQTERAAKAVLGRMTQAQRDALLVKYIQRNRRALLDALEGVAAQNGVPLKLRDGSAELK